MMRSVEVAPSKSPPDKRIANGDGLTTCTVMFAVAVCDLPSTARSLMVRVAVWFCAAVMNTPNVRLALLTFAAPLYLPALICAPLCKPPTPPPSTTA